MTVAQPRSRALPFVLLLILATALLPATRSPAAPAPDRLSAAREVLQAVHTDALHPTYVDGQLRLRTRVGSGTDVREVDPASVVFNLEDKESARSEIPPGIPALEFLGEPGDTLWIAPEVQQPDIIWPGWDTEALPRGAFEGDSVDLKLLGAQGPGRAEVWFSYDPVFGDEVRRVFSSTDPAWRVRRQSVGQHVHANWSFSALGTYTLTFEATATPAGGGAPVSSGPVDYTFVVGEYRAATETSTALQVSPNPATSDQSVTMTGTVTPAAATGSIDFFDGTRLLGGAPVDGGVAQIQSSGFDAGTHPITARFVPEDTDEFAGSTSPAVDLTVTGPSPTPSPTPTPTPTPTPSPTPPPDCVDVVLDAGHVDVAARTVGGALRTEVKDGTKDEVVWRDPAAVAFHIKPAARTEVPDDPLYQFLGPAGAPLWVIPQSEAEGILWAGWSTEAVAYDTLRGPVTWSLDKVEKAQGPGKVAVFQIDEHGQPIHQFDSGKPLPQNVSLPTPTHAHGNWAFTAEGIYELTFSHRATTKTGQTLTDTGTIAVAVGAVDLQDLCPGGTVPTPTPSATPTATQTPTGTPTSSPSSTPTPDPDDDGDDSPPQSVRCPTPSPSATSSTSTSNNNGDTVTLDEGHVDYAVRMEGSTLQSRIKDGTVAGRVSWRDPSTVKMRLTEATKTTIPGGAFGFLGPAGTPIWQIPQTQKAGAIWLGWNTEELSDAQLDADVRWRLDQVDGPGELAVFEFDSFGQPRVIFNSANGVPDNYNIRANTHAHGNWAFTKAGTYRVRFTHSVTLTDGRQFSDTATAAFEVGAQSSSGAGAGAVPAGNPAPVSCNLARTGGQLGIGWLGAGIVLVLLGITAIVATRQRGARS